jgi:signal transduction histidine kinase
LPLCIADAAELEAAILNAVINARDAMAARGRDGRLRIRTTAVTLGPAALAGNAEAQPGRFVAIELADNGTGMTPEVIGKAFEPFFTTKPAGQGTGLGLSQVFGFVRQLGGHVSITSVAGHGAAVTMFLPVAEQHVDAGVAMAGAG